MALGDTITTWIAAKGLWSASAYHVVGENIFTGSDATDMDTPPVIFDDLMHSEGHRENILRKQLSEVGIGARSGSYQDYDAVTTMYTMVFAGR